MPDLAVGDVIGSVRREIERTAFRARNGIKYVRGAEWAPIGPTPSDTVWQQGKVQLRHYRRNTPPTLGPPVLAFLGMVGRAYVFDLWKNNSIAQLLMDAGFDVFVLDWGEPGEEDAVNTLETYLAGALPRAIKAVERETGAREVSVIGYCMGGNLALHALAAQPELPVRNLVVMATPVDFRHLGPLIDALADGRIDLDSILDGTGNVPGALVRQSFKARKPTGDLVNYVNLWQNLWNDEYLEGFQAIGRWLQDHIPVPGALFKQAAQQWIQDNGFMTDRLKLGNRRVSLGAIHVPTLAVIAERDDIVPEPATAPITEILTGTKVDLMRLDAGHASLTSGRKAVKVLLPQVLDWLARHSEEVA
jgi:poly[(R)-3-hydroxyalkanoate] polymerase subunit PhaC